MKPESAPNPPAIGKKSHKGSAQIIRRDHARYPELPATELAKRAGCTVDNVYYVLKRFMGSNNLQQLREFQNSKADICDATALRLIESVTDEKLAKTSARDALVGFGIVTDKAALLRGQATSINVSVLMDVAELIRRKRNESA